MRSDEEFLRDILRLANELHFAIVGLTRDLFVSVDVVRSAALLKLILMGEAANYVSAELQRKYPELPWRRVIGFRNVAIHQYFNIDWNLVWNAATVDTPIVVEQVREILAAEFPELQTP